MRFLSAFFFIFAICLAIWSAGIAKEADPATAEAQKQKNADAKREESITLLEDLLKDERNRSQSPDLWLRLAELYWEKGKSMFFKEGAEREKGGGSEEFKESNLYKTKAIQIYQYIMKNFPEYHELDKTMLLLGLALYEMNKKKESEELFQRVIKESKNIPYKVNAYLALGEFYFDAQNMQEAITNYQFLLRYRDSKFYKYGMYKLGWCYFNLRDYPQAFKYFKGIVNVEKATDSDDKIRTFEITDDAITGLTLVFSEMVHGNEAQTALGLFKGMSPEKFPLIMYRLTTLFFNQGKNEETIIVGKDFLAIDPVHKHNPTVQKMIYEASLRMDNQNAGVNEKKVYVEKYNPNAPWFTAQVRTKDERDRVLENLEKVIRDLITRYMELSKQLKKPEFIGEAKQYHSQYFLYFPNSKNTHIIHANYAEFLFQLGEYQEAHQHYTTVINSQLPKNIREKAAYAAALSLENYKKEAKKKNQALPEGFNEKLIKAYQLYLGFNPPKEETIDTKFSIAKLLLEIGNSDAAEKGFLEIISDFGTSEEAMLSATLILKIHGDKQDIAKLNSYAKNFLANKNLHKGSFKDDLMKIVETTTFQLIGEMEKKQAFSAAAKAYLSFIANFPASLFADKAYNNAGINFEKAGDAKEAIRCYETLIDRYPGSTLVDNSAKNVVRLHTIAGNFLELATFAEKFATKFPNKEDAAKFYFQAAVVYEILKKTDRAATAYTGFQQRYPKDPKTKDLTYKIAKMYNDVGNKGQAKRYYEKYLSESDKSAELGLISFHQLFLMGSKAEKTAVAQRGISFYGQNQKAAGQGKGLEAVAAFRMWLLADEYERYFKIRLAMPEKNFPKQMKDKADSKKKLDDAMLGLIELGVSEVGIEALLKMAKLRVEFQDMILHDPTLKKLSKDEKEQVETQLKANTHTLVEEAISYLTKARDIAFRLNIYTDQTQEALKLLDDLQGSETPKAMFSLTPNNLNYVFEIQ